MTHVPPLGDVTPPLRRLEGRVAVVTGGAQGIGRGIVERFLAEGASVAALDIDRERGRELAAAAEAAMLPCLVLDCDVTSEHRVAEAVGETVGRFGGIDILVNNAGVNAYFDATALTEDEWDAFMAIDLKAPWLCAKHAIPYMKARGGGSIVNIASIHAVMTTPGMFPYAAAKSGLVGLTRSLALDYGPDGIRVNALCPGLTRTRLVQEWIDSEPDPAGLERKLAELQAVRRIGTPADMGACAAFLASDDAAFVTGAVLLVDGGLSARFATP